MSGAWFCEYPAHVGDRHDVVPVQRYTKRETYMRADGAARLHERSLLRICRACIRLDTAEAEAEQAQPALFDW